MKKKKLKPGSYKVTVAAMALGDFIEARLAAIARLRYTRTLINRLKIKSKPVETKVLDSLAYIEGVLQCLTMDDTNFNS